MNQRIAFIGGGNMASAIIGGLIRQGMAASQIDVVEPAAQTRHKLGVDHGVVAQEAAGPFLERARPGHLGRQAPVLQGATLPVRAHTAQALHLSVAAGIRSDSIAKWLGSERIVRAMPNTPALIGKGISALFARAAVSVQDQQRVTQVMANTGELLWLDAEEKLDAVTALSGSGPAYVFYFMEAMTTAGVEIGLTREQAHQLSLATFIGAGELVRSTGESPKSLRQKVTSPGGTTQAAIGSMEDDDLQAQIINAIYAARKRARELGDAFGAD